MKTFNNDLRILVVCILCFSYSLSVAATGRIDADSLAARLMYQVWSFPQEKVYVSTDRAAYLSGDTIRLRAFLVDAASHSRPRISSKFVYAELLNPFGDVVKRIKIRERDSIFAGILPLDPELAEGNYTLCAYTQYMQNADRDYFFRKNIPVYCQLSGKYQFKTEYIPGHIFVRLTDKKSGDPIKADNISVTDRAGEFYAHNIRNRSSYNIKITKRMASAGHIKIKFDKYEKYLAVPGDTADMSLTFHPEGGYLIPGKENRLAFKAIDKKGHSIDCAGVILDERNDTVDYIHTSHKGMGMTLFTPKEGKRYKAKVGNMIYQLPAQNAKACVLNIDRIGSDSILIRVEGRFRSGLSLLAHNGGAVCISENMKDKQIAIPVDRLGSGIVQFLLADSNGTILSSRMFFNRRGYIYRSQLDSLPAGDYAVRAFREKGLNADTTSSIVSGLLLQSELKGHIEDPDYYFRNDDSATDANLDLLMMTQGWERYDIPNALRNRFAQPTFPMEIGGEISGTARTRWSSRPLTDAVVMLISPQLDYASQTITDANGKFTFNGMDWPENTVFVIQVLDKSGNKEHNYAIDEEKFPTIKPIESSSVDDLTVAASVDEHLLTAGTIMLEDLVVTAPLSAEESRREMLAALGVKSFTSKDFDKDHITSYEEVIRKIPGLRIINGNVISAFAKGTYNTGQAGSNVEFWIDGTRWAPASSSSGRLARSMEPQPMNAPPTTPEHTYREHISNSLSEFAALYPFHIIKSIEYFRPSTAMIISREAVMGGGALVITTKDRSKIREWDHDLFIKTFTPPGYQNQAESYRPHYIYDPTTDDETFNAAWLPKITGIEALPDQKDIYVEIEGIADGNIPVSIRTHR